VRAARLLAYSFFRGAANLFDPLLFGALMERGFA